jgi:hypothetical protein
MPNENEKANNKDDEMDIDTAFDNSGVNTESSPLMPNEKDIEFEIDNNKNIKSNAVLTPCVLVHMARGELKCCNKQHT